MCTFALATLPDLNLVVGLFCRSLRTSGVARLTPRTTTTFAARAVSREPSTSSNWPTSVRNLASVARLRCKLNISMPLSTHQSRLIGRMHSPNPRRNVQRRPLPRRRRALRVYRNVASGRRSGPQSTLTRCSSPTFHTLVSEATPLLPYSSHPRNANATRHASLQPQPTISALTSSRSVPSAPA